VIRGYRKAEAKKNFIIGVGGQLELSLVEKECSSWKPRGCNRVMPGRYPGFAAGVLCIACEAESGRSGDDSLREHGLELSGGPNSHPLLFQLGAGTSAFAFS
jgi:hypothetical protein